MFSCRHLEGDGWFAFVFVHFYFICLKSKYDASLTKMMA